MEPSPTRRRSFVVRAPSSASGLPAETSSEEAVAWATALREHRRATVEPGLSWVHCVVVGGAVCFLLIMLQLYSQVTSMASFVQPDRQMRPTRLDVAVDLATLFHGGVQTVYFEKQVVCADCDGHGYDQAAGLKKCPMCGGAGMVVHEQRFGHRVHRVRHGCDRCSGAGHLPNRVCHACHGHGHHVASASIAVPIAPGMMHGDEILFAGDGDAQRHVATGDVLVRLVPSASPTSFVRRGDDLETIMVISLLEALTGVTTSMEHLSGDLLPITTHDVLHPHAVLRVPGQGMPLRHDPRRRGDLLVRFEIRFPTALTAAQIAGLPALLPDVVAT
ncbi:hypothetical protein SPRG_19323 [Saprolegnia parasitica CBS 223.65]|uniref:CR-type domain-containing protein n=1 Tax=Saprolegnia parasitica (strain CBS 223.65) TaxID=695850 RepID=A0A067CTA4_SAPPC|nr:hypothetical protein SPRG_19323 [Saprolegnia parasitica CBS 223.65]KDO33713.1 hypothetical protein SPRG_19323 [Saprolegnia parasitica CBS 223.65]|eukprot:XP_012195734.1 hypothetical protein SPRG_19323 [Saprolegnia parasitica CBS 223.65]